MYEIDAILGAMRPVDLLSIVGQHVPEPDTLGFVTLLIVVSTVKVYVFPLLTAAVSSQNT